MRVAIATCSALPPEFTDDERLAGALHDLGVSATVAAWDDPTTDWTAFDCIVIRSTWDYTQRRDQFLRWADGIDGRLHNRPGVVRWNSDKHYLGDLAEAGVASVPTVFVEPGARPPTLEGDVVVKPAVSAGARDTGRFGAPAHDRARRLIEDIGASGRSAMVQPYQSSVDSGGETAIVCLAGEPIHALRKGAVLRPDEVAPVRDDALGAAEVMYDPGLVESGVATPAELALARTALGYVAARFGEPPLYARVDMVAGADGEPVLMELELIEPSLYLDRHPGSVERLASAIVARLPG